MTTWSRLLLAATALAVGASPAAAQTEPAQTEPAPIEAQDAPEDGEVVNSWALAPAGSSDPAGPGNRPNLSYETSPSSTIEDAVTLVNYSNVPLTFRLYATDAFNTDDGGFDVLPGREEPTDVGTWVTVAQDTIRIPAEKQATIPITIRIPADATPGDHVGAVLASSEVEGTGADGKLVTLDRRTGSRLYVRVAGDLVPQLAVEGVTTSYDPSLNPLGGKAEVAYRVENRGNVRLGGTHRVSVSGPFGVGRRSAPVEDLPELLPGESIELTASFDGVAASVLAFTDVELEPAPIEGDEGATADDGRATTIAVPLTLVAVLLVAALALYARRSYRRHGVRELGVVGPAR